MTDIHKEIEEAIEELNVLHKSWGHTSVHTNKAIATLEKCSDLLAVEALRSVNSPKPFDVLEYLRNGGKITRSGTCSVHWVKLCAASDDLVTYQGNKISFKKFLERLHQWQPYEEPELEDGCWYWCDTETGPQPVPVKVIDGELDANFLCKVLRHPDGTPMKIEEPKP